MVIYLCKKYLVISHRSDLTHMHHAYAIYRININANTPQKIMSHKHMHKWHICSQGGMLAATHEESVSMREINQHTCSHEDTCIRVCLSCDPAKLLESISLRRHNRESATTLPPIPLLSHDMRLCRCHRLSPLPPPSPPVYRLASTVINIDPASSYSYSSSCWLSAQSHSTSLILVTMFWIANYHLHASRRATARTLFLIVDCLLRCS